MEDWDEEDLEEDKEEEEIDESEDQEPEDEKPQEQLEEIIQETPTVSYPRATNRWPSSGSSIIPQFSQSQPLETGLQEIQTQTPTQEPQTAENAPEYSSIIYQETIRQEGRSQTEAGYPEQIHIGSQSFSPSLPQHLLQSQFSTLPGTIQQRDMSSEPAQIRPQEKKYQSDFEQNKKDRRRF